MKNCVAALMLLASPVWADTPVLTAFDGSFDDATFAVESAIVGKGLVIDYVSHVGDMLNRTGGDVGSDTVIFDQADVFLFCSAVLSREVMDADPSNIQHCPYAVFVTQVDDQVMIGHRDYAADSMAPVKTLLIEIVEEATAF